MNQTFGLLAVSLATALPFVSNASKAELEARAGPDKHLYVAEAFAALTLADRGVQDAAAPTAVRPLEPRAVRLLERGLAASDTFRTLMAEISPSRAVVYVDMDAYLDSGLRGVTRLLRGTADERMMLIVLNPRAVDDDLVAVLGHELQHVKEMVLAKLRTPRDVETYYRAFGLGGMARRYETREALAVESRVRLELASSRSR